MIFVTIPELAALVVQTDTITLYRIKLLIISNTVYKNIRYIYRISKYKTPPPNIIPTLTLDSKLVKISILPKYMTHPEN